MHPAKNTSDRAARLGTSLFTKGFYWGTGPWNHALLSRFYAIPWQAKGWVWTQVVIFRSDVSQRGIQRFCSPPATVAGLYSPLGHWRWPQAQNASQPTTTRDSPSLDFRCLSDNWEWGCFHGSGNNIDNKVHIYWTTWHVNLNYHDK